MNGHDYEPFYYEEDPDRLYDDPNEDPYYGDIEWRQIEGEEGYEVGSNGMVRSWRGTDAAHILKPWKSNGGHYYVGLNGRRRESIHRLVANAFIPNPNNYPLVRHLNDIPTDNRIENLAWGTQKDNIEDSKRNGHMFVKSVYCYETDRIYKSCADAAVDLGVDRSSVTMCCQGKVHETKGFHLCYLSDREERLKNKKAWLNHSQYKPVKATNLRTGEEIIFGSRGEAAKYLGIPDCGISSTISGRTPHSHGWKFEDWSDHYECAD